MKFWNKRAQFYLKQWSYFVQYLYPNDSVSKGFDDLKFPSKTKSSYLKVKDICSASLYNYSSFELLSKLGNKILFN